MANNLVEPRGYLTRPAMVPSKSSYVGTWLWDSALHAIAYRHIDPELARDQIRVMLAQQLPDGMLPDAIFDEGVVIEIDHPIPGKVTKPPIMAWAVLKSTKRSRIWTFLARSTSRWYARIAGGSNTMTTTRMALSSTPILILPGLDDSPLWDHGMPVESPDINTYLQIQMASLAAIAKPSAGRRRHRHGGRKPMH
jgi:putative isomerase